MSLNLQEKLNRSQEIAGKMQALASKLDEARKAGQGSDEGAMKEFDALSAEYDSLKGQIEEERNADRVSDRMRQINEDQQRSIRHGKPKPGLDDRIPGEERTYGDAGFGLDEARQHAKTEIDKRNAFKAWMVSEFAPELVDRRMQEDAAKLGLNLNAKQVNVRFNSESFKRLQREARRTHPSRLQDDLESRALSKVASPGTELVPQTFIAQIELAMLTFGPLLSYVTALTTDDGRQIPWPTGDDTGNGGLVAAEGADINAQSQPDPTMGTIPLGAFEYTSRFIKVPNTLIRDSMVDIDLMVAGFIGERMGRLYTQDATVGTGTGQMQGIRAASAAGVTAASATAISGDDVVNLVHSVDQAYRANGVFMANDAIIARLRLLKDTTGQYLWQSNLREGMPDTLLGRPVIPNPNMASTLAATNISMLFGDFSKYMFRRVGTGILFRLQERFVESLQTGYLFHQSADGRLIRANTTTLNPVKRLTH